MMPIVSYLDFQDCLAKKQQFKQMWKHYWLIGIVQAEILSSYILYASHAKIIKLYV